MVLWNGRYLSIYVPLTSLSVYLSTYISIYLSIFREAMYGVSVPDSEETEPKDSSSQNNRRNFGTTYKKIYILKEGISVPWGEGRILVPKYGGVYHFYANYSNYLVIDNFNLHQSFNDLQRIMFSNIFLRSLSFYLSLKHFLLFSVALEYRAFYIM